MLDRNVLLTIFSRLAIIVGGIATSILTARFLGPAGRGDYFFVVTFAALVAQFASLGLQSSNTYLVARDATLLGRLTANSLWVALLAGGGGAAILIFALQVAGVASTGTPGILCFAIALAPATLLFMLGTNLLVGIGEIVSYNGFQIFSNILVLIAISVAALVKSGTEGFLTASALAWSLIALSVFTLLKRRGGRGLAFHGDTFKKGLRYATKAYLATLLGFLVLRANIFFLKNMSGSQEIGYYSIAAQIGDVLGILPSSVALVLFPDLVRNQAGSWEATRKTLFSVGWMLLLACAVAALLVEPFVKIMFGTAFLPAIPMLLWMLPGTFFLGLTTIVSQHLAAAGFPRILVVVWILAFCVVASSSALLIPAYAGSGAAMSLSLTYLVLFCLVCGVALKREAYLKNT